MYVSGWWERITISKNPGNGLLLTGKNEIVLGEWGGGWVGEIVREIDCVRICVLIN